MVRRLQQCIHCQRRFVAQSTDSTVPQCPKCCRHGDSSSAAMTHVELAIATTSSSVPESKDPDPIATNKIIYSYTKKKSDTLSLASVPDTTTTIDLLSSSVNDDDNDSRPDDFDDKEDSSDDEDEDMPLAQLISIRKSLDGGAQEENNMETHPVLAPILNHEQEASRQEGENEDLTVCNVCGSCLKHIASWNGRLNHLKRCSQRHGVTAQQMHRDEEPLEQENNNALLEQSVPKEKTKSINQILMAGARRKAIQEKHKHEATATAKKPRRGGWGQQRRAPSGNCPEYKKIPGTDFVVDGFYYAKPSLTSNYFLTHFHSDHYGGLTKSWSAGIIYCSSVTANLVEQQLGVPRRYLHVLPLNQTMTIETRSGRMVKVTLIDANHCPGAVLLFFQVGERTILHVGDFRWNRAQHLSPLHNLLQGRRLERIFLDTTYCVPKHTLPSQQAAITATVQYALALVQEAKKRKQRLLLLFGAYTIGKERIYLAVAKALGMKVYVDSRRFRILSALEWPQEQRAMLTKNSEETILWVVPLGHISMKKLPSYTSLEIGRVKRTFDRVVGFRPTGWSLRGGGKSKSNKENGESSDLLTVCNRGSLTTCSVPYSEHSAFPELVDCLACLQPRIIVPTVNVRKSQEQIHLLMEHLEKT